MEVSDLLRERRQELGKTQEQVAQKAGMNVTQYNGYERARSAPSPATLQRLAHALETTPEALLRRSPITSADRADNKARGDVLRRLRDQFRVEVAAELGLAPEYVNVHVQIL